MTDAESFDRVYRAALEGARSLSDGPTVWRVYELPAPPYDRRVGSSLVFENASVIRRVRRYPRDWRALDDAALLRLCEEP